MEEKSYMDFPRITESGKYAVVYDIAHDENGNLYYCSCVGSKQMCEGIAAALLDNGHRNKNAVYLNTPLNGEDGMWNKSMQVKVASSTIGAMRRVTRKVQGTRVSQVVLFSNLIKWDYNYLHVQKKNALDEKEESDYEKAQRDLSTRRFVLFADPDESEQDTARRWFAYLPKRVSEPLLAEWALPLWDHCVEAGKGVKTLTRMRGKAWLCEPSSTSLRDAISEMGRRGELYLPDNCSPVTRGNYYEAEFAVAAD